MKRSWRSKFVQNFSRNFNFEQMIKDHSPAPAVLMWNSVMMRKWESDSFIREPPSVSADRSWAVWELVSQLCQKPISLRHSSSSATSCCALSRGAHLTLMYDGSRPEQSPRFSSLTSGWGTLYRLLMIPHPPFSLPSPALASSLLHCFSLHVRSKVRATGSARRTEALIRHCLLLIFLFRTPLLCDEDEREWRCSLSQQSLYVGSWHQRNSAPLRNHIYWKPL